MFSLLEASDIVNLLFHRLFLIMTSFSIFRQHCKNSKKFSLVMNTFENIMENGAFA